MGVKTNLDVTVKDVEKRRFPTKHYVSVFVNLPQLISCLLMYLKYPKITHRVATLLYLLLQRVWHISNVIESVCYSCRLVETLVEVVEE